MYVAYDSRVRKIPRWLRDFEPLSSRIRLNEPDPRQHFVLYRKRFDTADVVLGGNRAVGAEYSASGGSNYLVIVKRVAAGKTQ